MSRVKAAFRRALPPPVLARVQSSRGAVARAVAGTELFRLRQENDQLRAELAAAMDRHGRDVVARTDAVLSSYDRRLAAVANRVMDLEDRIGATTAAGTDGPDANRILADHEEHPG